MDSATTDKKMIEVVTYEITPRITVDVPVAALRTYNLDGGIEDLRDDEILDIILEDTDLVPDALATMFENMNFTTAYVDVDCWEGPHEAEELGKVDLYKPGEDTGGLYTLPVPNMISGNVIFTEDGIEPVEVSNVNKLTDDQLEGAYYAVKRVWGLRGMHRYQREQIAEFLSELQWAMLARPSRHVFHVGEVAKGIVQDTPLCKHCGNPAEGHLVREEKTDAEG